MSCLLAESTPTVGPNLWPGPLAAVIYGAMMSLAAVILEEVSFRRYPRLGDLIVLGLYGVFENFGYRQMATWWRVRGVFRFFKGAQDWGTMTRKGFEKA